MISGILGRTSREDDGGISINPNWIISTVMHQAETIRARIKIVDAVLSRVLEGHPLLQEWKGLSGRLFKRARDRNVVVHSVWAWSEDAPQGVIQVVPHGSNSLWIEADFADAFARIHTLETDLHLFKRSVLTEVHEGRIRSYPTVDGLNSVVY